MRVWRTFAAGFLLSFGLIVPALQTEAFGVDACDSAMVLIGCSRNADEAKEAMDAAESQGRQYKFVQSCTEGEQCQREGCVDKPSGLPGTWYDMFLRDNPAADWVHLGEFCMPFAREAEFKIITWQAVWREAKKLHWPGAELVVQPPGGRTLVNFDTNFYTTSTEPHTVQVTLLGTAVEVEATPDSYTWHWGDGTTSETTASAGSPYPDLDVTHRYTVPGTYEPSVDITYTGRFRINGGEWQDIPDTHTVPGRPAVLDVVTARPELVQR